jgi:response regulator RpfG family c-di-GMP phosphodiesterase
MFGEAIIGEKANILLVDDRPENLLALEGVLGDKDYSLFKATSGREALRMVIKHKFDLILLDVQMPGMDGFETAQLIHEKKSLEHIPIIFITAISKEQEYIHKGYSVGAENYLFKPINPDDLKSKVKTSLNYHRYKHQMEVLEKRTMEAKQKRLLASRNGAVKAL